jgi:N6-L-threonylcarbamoyladenine synthase
VLRHISKNTERALTWCAENLDRPVSLVISGGVARNEALRQSLRTVAESAGVPAAYPPARLCTDNGIMIAWAGIERLNAGYVDAPDDVIVRPRWPLDKSGKTHYPISGDKKSIQRANYVVQQPT